MTDIEELRKDAEHAAKLHMSAVRANPATILSLIGEIDRLKAALTEIAENENGDYYDGDAAFARRALTEDTSNG
jgi:hypothetical protein